MNLDEVDGEVLVVEAGGRRAPQTSGTAGTGTRHRVGTHKTVRSLGADGAAAPDWRNGGTSASPAVAAAWAGARSEAAGTAGRGRSGGPPTPSTSSAPCRPNTRPGATSCPSPSADARTDGWDSPHD